MRLRLLGTLVSIACLGVDVVGATPPSATLSPHEDVIVRGAPPAAEQARPPHVIPLQSDSIEEWWRRAKRALHHLSGCALASAGITYGLIAGVAFPGAAILGLTGAGVVVLMCL